MLRTQQQTKKCSTSRHSCVRCSFAFSKRSETLLHCDTRSHVTRVDRLTVDKSCTCEVPDGRREDLCMFCRLLVVERPALFFLVFNFAGACTSSALCERASCNLSTPTLLVLPSALQPVCLNAVVQNSVRTCPPSKSFVWAPSAERTFVPSSLP